MKLFNEKILNDTFEPLAVGFQLMAENSSGDNEVIITDLMSKSTTGIKITRHIDDLPDCTISFEFSASHDAYMNEPKQIPPWYIFQVVSSGDIKYKIGYKYINNDILKVRCTSYNQNETISKQVKAISKFSEELIKYKEQVNLNGGDITQTVKKGMNESISLLAKELSAIDDQIVESLKTPIYEEQKSDGWLISGTPLTNSFSGDEAGIIKFDVSIFEKLTMVEKIKSETADLTLTKFTSQSQLLVSSIEIFNFLNDSLLGDKTVADFLKILFGGLQTDSQKIIDSNPSYSYDPNKRFSINDSILEVTVNDDFSDIRETIKQNRISVDSFLKSKKLKISYETVEKLRFMVYNNDISGSHIDSSLEDSLQGPFLYDGSLFKKEIADAVKAHNVTNEAIRVNKPFLLRDFLKLANSFRDEVKKIPGINLIDYLKLIKKYFNISFDIKTNVIDDSSIYKNAITFSVGTSSISSSTPISNSAITGLQGNETKIIVIEYGGMAVNFSHSVKTSGVDIHDISSNTMSVTATLDNTISLKIELDVKLIQKDAQKIYTDAKESWVAYSKFIADEIKANPDAFLLKYVKFTPGGFVSPIAPGLKKKSSNQLLTITLRNPIPNIKPQDIIFFTSMGGESQKLSSLVTSPELVTLDLESDSPFYVLPPRVRGIYVVTKVIDTFNVKQNIWSQVVECER